MNELELVNSLLEQLGGLAYDDEVELDAIIRRAEMVIRRVFGEGSKYLQDLRGIRFHSMSFPCTEEFERTCWSSGKERMHNLFSTMKEELLTFPEGSVENRDVEATSTPRPDSVAYLVQVLLRFRHCCQYVTLPPQCEEDVQDILWIMLRSHFDQLERHSMLPRFGTKSYIPDFGIPHMSALVEVKFIGPKTDVSAIQESILADIPGYLNDPTTYDSVVVFVYDAAHKLRNDKKFIGDLMSVEGIVDVVVVPGLG